MPFIALLAFLSGMATVSPPTPTDAELVARLAVPATRDIAWAELERRRPPNELDEKTDAYIHLTRRLVGVLPCPQREGPPLTLAIARYEAASESTSRNEEPPYGSSLERRSDLSLTLFTAAGERLQGVYGLTDGVLADLDGDGLIEIADR